MTPDWKIVFCPRAGRLECLAGWRGLAPWRDLPPVFGGAAFATLSMIAENLDATGNGLLLSTIERIRDRVGEVPGVEALRAVLVGLVHWRLIEVWNVGDGRFVFEVPAWRAYGRVSA